LQSNVFSICALADSEKLLSRLLLQLPQVCSNLVRRTSEEIETVERNFSLSCTRKVQFVHVVNRSTKSTLGIKQAGFRPWEIRTIYECAAEKSNYCRQFFSGKYEAKICG